MECRYDRVFVGTIIGSADLEGLAKNLLNENGILLVCLYFASFLPVFPLTHPLCFFFVQAPLEIGQKVQMVLVRCASLGGEVIQEAANIEVDPNIGKVIRRGDVRLRYVCVCSFVRLCCVLTLVRGLLRADTEGQAARNEEILWPNFAARHSHANLYDLDLVLRGLISMSCL